MASPSISQRFVSMLASRGTHGEVVSAASLSPNLKLIRIAGPSLQRLEWTPGDKIKLHVPPGALRSYTPARLDRAEGTLDVVFHLHDNGKAARWARHVQPGAPVSFLGPGRSIRTTHGAQVGRTLFLGDETTVGLMRALIDALPPAATVRGAIEIAAEDVPAIDALALPLTAVRREAEHGSSVASWLESADLEGLDGVWLSGEADAVARWVEQLTTRGVDRRLIRAKAYWSTRGHDHRKSVERRAGIR